MRGPNRIPALFMISILFGSATPEIAQFLIDTHHLDINKRSESGLTPLLAAAFDKRFEVLELLLTKGADSSATTDVKKNGALHLLLMGFDSATADLSSQQQVEFTNKLTTTVQNLMNSGVAAGPNQNGDVPSTMARDRGLSDLAGELLEYEKRKNTSKSVTKERL